MVVLGYLLAIAQAVAGLVAMVYALERYRTDWLAFSYGALGFLTCLTLIALLRSRNTELGKAGGLLGLWIKAKEQELRKRVETNTPVTPDDVPSQPTP